MALRAQATKTLTLAEREQEVARAELEAQSLESQLQNELERLSTQAAQLRQRHAALGQALERVAPGAAADAIRQRIQGGGPTAPELDRPREHALAARVEAVTARRKTVDALKQGLDGFQKELRDALNAFEADTAEVSRLQREAETAAQRRPSSPPPPAAAAQPPPRAMPPPLGKTPPGMTPPAMTPRRERPRVRMQAAVDLSSESNFFTGFSTNISEGGLFIATVHNLPQGTPVDIVFTLGSKKLTVHGEVRWTREVNDADPSIFPGVGVQFKDLAPEVHDEIKKFVEGREPLFFPD